MKNKDHIQVHLELCQRMFLRLEQEGTLEETLAQFEKQKKTKKQGSDR